MIGRCLKVFFALSVGVIPFSFNHSVVAQSAVAQSATEQLQILVDEATGQIPDSYEASLKALLESGSNGMSKAFKTPIERADCRFGGKSGNQIATSLMKGLKPSCDRLLAPIGNEWIPPLNETSSSAFGKCFDFTFSLRVSQIVFDTAVLCAWQGFESSMTSAQIEYNRCYISVANEVEFSSFIIDPFQPGKFALIPSDTERWNSMLARIRSTYGNQTGFLTMACEVGKSDAESGILPQNLLKRK